MDILFTLLICLVCVLTTWYITKEILKSKYTERIINLTTKNGELSSRLADEVSINTTLDAELSKMKIVPPIQNPSDMVMDDDVRKIVKKPTVKKTVRKTTVKKPVVKKKTTVKKPTKKVVTKKTTKKK